MSLHLYRFRSSQFTKNNSCCPSEKPRKSHATLSIQKKTFQRNPILLFDMFGSEVLRPPIIERLSWILSNVSGEYLALFGPMDALLSEIIRHSDAGPSSSLHQK